MLLDRVDWQALSTMVQRQQRNREAHTPTISLFRWWARRSHVLFGELLQAAQMEFPDQRFVVSDPFSGGGTVAVEATRRGLPVYAQDLQPWAAIGLVTALDHVSPHALRASADAILAQLQQVRSSSYETVCPLHGPSEIVHTYWVRVGTCGHCNEAMYLYPHPLVTYAERVERKNVSHDGFWGCAKCGHVTVANRESKQVECQLCASTVYAKGEDAKGEDAKGEDLLKGNTITCPHCSAKQAIDVVVANGLQWSPILVQRLCGSATTGHLHLAIPTAEEVLQANGPWQIGAPAVLTSPIPEGRETSRLLKWGYTQWRHLYPDRQLNVYLSAIEAIRSHVGLPASIRQRLLLAVCGAPEMAGYSSRWDRFHLKAFEAVANHRFSSPTLSVEVNPLGPRGRGTIPRRFSHSVKAAEWMMGQPGAQSLGPATLLTVGAQSPRLVPENNPLVAVGSSDHQLLESQTAKLVLTDPPYYGDVQYGELSSLFTAWGKHSGLIPEGQHAIDYAKEAVGKDEHPSADSYAQLLRSILSETRRTLSPNGRLVFTFRHSQIEAWGALGRALDEAGYRIARLATVHAENETDHAKRDTGAFTKDLVLECVPTEHMVPVLVSSTSEDDEARELVAIGTTLAQNPGGDVESISRTFEVLRVSVPSEKRRIKVKKGNQPTGLKKG